MSQERLDKLERIVIKMESSISNLSEKMNDVASALSTMSNAVSKLALYDVKIERIEKDLTNVASSVRVVNQRITDLHDSHAHDCAKEFTEVRDEGVKRLYLGLSAAAAMITFVFGYLYLDISNHKKQDKANIEDMIEIKTDIAVIKERLAKSNRYMYHISKEIKEKIDEK